MRLLLRPLMKINPSLSINPRSPVCSQPSSSMIPGGFGIFVIPKHSILTTQYDLTGNFCLIGRVNPDFQCIDLPARSANFIHRPWRIADQRPHSSCHIHCKGEPELFKECFRFYVECSPPITISAKLPPNTSTSVFLILL